MFPQFSFAAMLGDDFDAKQVEQSVNGSSLNDCVPLSMPLPFFQTTDPSDPDMSNTSFPLYPPKPDCVATDQFKIPPVDMNWMNDFTKPAPVRKRRHTTGKIKISGKDIPPPLPSSPLINEAGKSSEKEEKKMSEKERHKVRQRQRRQKMTNTMDRLKSMVPECVKREAEAAEGNKKMKVDQTQLLEMTVEYIQQLTDTISQLEQENRVLRSCVNVPHSDISGSDTSNDLSSSPDHGSPGSDQSLDDALSFYDGQPTHIFDDMEQASLLGKRNLSNLYQGEVAPRRNAKQPTLVRAARVLMVLFVFGIFYYTPISYPSSPYLPQSVPAVGRVLHSTGDMLTQSLAGPVNWIGFMMMLFFTKLIMLMSWTFCAMLLDYIYVPGDHLVKLAKQENDIGVKKYDRGDYHGSRRHFEKALTYLGRSPSPSWFYRAYHLPLEMWRQVLHLLRIGLWCDGHLVHIRGGQEYMLETARCNHYLFSLNMLANNLDSHSILHLVVSLNAAESLYQKPPLLAEVYATIGIAFYGLLKMPKAYQYLMGKAWHIVDNFQEEKPNESSVDNTKAYLLFLSSYGSLCDGNLQEVQAQIQRGCDLFLKKGNKNMFFQGQFFISYTHFLKGNYFTTMQIMKSIEVCNLGDPRISWWREVLIICCKLCLHDNVTERDLIHFENLYSKVESHSTFAPSLAVLQQSILALLLLRLGKKDRALGVAMEALDSFEDSSFTGWIFYCGYYISEVFFTVWEEEKQNANLVNQISRLTHRLCTCLRKVAKVCELARPAAFLVIGRYTLNMKEYTKAIDYLERAAEAADDCSVESYKVQASWLIDRAEYEALHPDEYPSVV